MMTLKRMVFRLCVRSLEWLTLHSKPTRIYNLPLFPIKEKQIDIITVAFNNAQLIRYQEQFINKYLTDKFTHIIVDNSTNIVVREELFNYCCENKIAYIGLPKNYLNRIGASYSHAAALNYVYQHVICKRQPWAFGQIDHDLFPTRAISIIEKLTNQPIYGPLRSRGKCWYLSAIMSFFRYDFIKNKKVDFMPTTPDTIYLDSGGGNWYDIYSSMNLEELTFPNECIEPLRKGGNRHSDSLEYFDDKLWLHTINGSCWKKIEREHEKNNIVKHYLDTILAQE